MLTITDVILHHNVDGMLLIIVVSLFIMFTEITVRFVYLICFMFVLLGGYTIQGLLEGELTF